MPPLTYGVLVLIVLWTLLQFNCSTHHHGHAHQPWDADHHPDNDNVTYTPPISRIKRPPDKIRPQTELPRDDTRTQSWLLANEAVRSDQSP